MDPRIESLQSATFFGQRLTRKQIADIQETVACFPRLSRHELGQTICEHLGWRTPKGNNRIQLTLRVLEELERLGILTLPALNSSPGRGCQRPLGMAARQLPADWQRAHGVRPVLIETYVDPKRHKATCYRAANPCLTCGIASCCK